MGVKKGTKFVEVLAFTHARGFHTRRVSEPIYKAERMIADAQRAVRDHFDPPYPSECLSE